MKRPFYFFLAALLLCGGGCRGENSGTIYDANPEHLWNRLNETLFDRTAPDGKHYGLGELDILYWHTTPHLLAGPSRAKAVAVLDEFIRAHGEQEIRDPLKRVLLQRDLWELFDWSAKIYPKPELAGAIHELQARLAVVIRRLALTTNEIAALPDNCARSQTENLPPSLLATNGDWLAVHDLDELTAPAHVASFDGHSIFTAHLQVPGGRPAGENYLEALHAFARTNRWWVYHTNNFLWANTNGPEEVLELNAAIPQFPTNTAWALVRQLVVIDADGKLQPTRFVESVQLRRYFSLAPAVYVTVTNQAGNISAEQLPRQKFFEFQLNRRDAGRLREIGPQEKGFPFAHFFGKGIDPFEPDGRFGQIREPEQDSARATEPILLNCFTCHNGRGIFSVNTFTRSLSFPRTTQGPAQFVTDGVERDVWGAVEWKQGQFSWGLLQGLWRRSK